MIDYFGIRPETPETPSSLHEFCVLEKVDYQYTAAVVKTELRKARKPAAIGLSSLTHIKKQLKRIAVGRKKRSRDPMV
jgi:hypothetical protein